MFEEYEEVHDNRRKQECRKGRQNLFLQWVLKKQIRLRRFQTTQNRLVKNSKNEIEIIKVVGLNEEDLTLYKFKEDNFYFYFMRDSRKMDENLYEI